MNRRRLIAASVAAPFIIHTGAVRAGGWAAIRLAEPIPPVTAGEPFTIRFSVHGHDMEEHSAPGLPITITLRHRESRELVRFSWPGRRTTDPLYELEMAIDEPGPYKWSILPESYPALPMPTLHVIEPGDDPEAFLIEPSHGDIGAEVQIAAQAYSPAEVTITAGEAVRWINNDSMAHQVAWQSLELDDSPLIEIGEEVSVSFPNPGEFSYYCGPHPWMSGAVTVTRSAQSAYQGR